MNIRILTSSNHQSTPALGANLSIIASSGWNSAIAASITTAPIDTTKIGTMTACSTAALRLNTVR